MDDSSVKHRKIGLITLVVVFVLSIVLISVKMILDNKQITNVGEVEKSSGIMIENSGFASSTIGGSLFGMIAGDIEAVIMDESEKAAAPSENKPGDNLSADTYTIEIDNSGLLSKVSFPYSVYSFSFSVSDNRKYDVNIAANLPGYYGVLISRTMPKQDTPKMFIVFLGNETQYNYNRKNIISNLLKWAKGFSPEGVYLTTKSIF